MIFSIPALLALVGVIMLAFVPDNHALTGAQMGPDRVTLWFLFICALVAQVPTLKARLVASRDATTWALLCAFFVLFHLADRAGPREGWSITFPFAPDDPTAVSYATRIVVIGALLSIPLWIREGGPQRAIVVALGLVGAFGLGMFWFLGRHFPIGADSTLSPLPMRTLIVQIVGYGALALCCRAVTAIPIIRSYLISALPAVLLLVGLRHQLMPIPAPPEDE